MQHANRRKLFPYQLFSGLRFVFRLALSSLMCVHLGVCLCECDRRPMPTPLHPWPVSPQSLEGKTLKPSRTNAHRQTMGHGNWSHIKACSPSVSPAQDEWRETDRGWEESEMTARREEEIRWHVFMKIEQKDVNGQMRKRQSRQEIWWRLRLKRVNKEKKNTGH